MTVAQMCEAMPSAEFVEWQALDSIRNAEAEKEERLARKGMRPRR